MIYLAGPFFNKVQRDAAWKLIALCKLAHVEYFAPIEQDSIRINSPEKAAKVFANNIEAMMNSSIMLAQLDWLMLNGEELRVVKEMNIGLERPAYRELSPILNLPDTGTVFEMGYAHGLNMEIIGYTITEQSRINLMLAQACSGFLKGWAAIETWLEKDTSVLDLQWRGKIQ